MPDVVVIVSLMGAPGRPGTAGATRLVTAAGVVALTTADQGGMVRIRKAAPAPTTVQFPAGPADGDTYAVKDALGDAFVNPITLSTTDGTLIDGQATQLIQTAWGAATGVYSAADRTWNIR